MLNNGGETSYLGNIGNISREYFGTLKDAVKEAKEASGLSYPQFLLESLRQSLVGGSWMIWQEILNGFEKMGIMSVEDVVEKDSQKVAILLSGYGFKPRILNRLADKLREKNVRVEHVDHRFFKPSDAKIIHQKVKDIVDKNPQAFISLFGYSVGGILAHKIGHGINRPSVSYGIGKKNSGTLTRVLLSLFGARHSGAHVGPSSTSDWRPLHIVESFSGITPAPNANLPEDSIRIPGVFSHMSMHDDRVADEIVKGILRSMELEMGPVKPHSPDAT